MFSRVKCESAIFPFYFEYIIPTICFKSFSQFFESHVCLSIGSFLLFQQWYWTLTCPISSTHFSQWLFHQTQFVVRIFKNLYLFWEHHQLKVIIVQISATQSIDHNFVFDFKISYFYFFFKSTTKNWICFIFF